LNEDVERSERIRRFAAAYVFALGLTGDDAASIRSEIQDKLEARELLDDAELVTRVRRIQRDEDLRASGLSQEQIDATREQLYGTNALDSYRGQASRLIELVIQGDDSARQRIAEQIEAATGDVDVTPDQVAALKRLAHDALAD
jgi:hypothetical protein